MNTVEFNYYFGFNTLEVEAEYRIEGGKPIVKNWDCWLENDGDRVEFATSTIDHNGKSLTIAIFDQALKEAQKDARQKAMGQAELEGLCDDCDDSGFCSTDDEGCVNRNQEKAA